MIFLVTPTMNTNPTVTFFVNLGFWCSFLIFVAGIFMIFYFFKKPLLSLLGILVAMVAVFILIWSSNATQYSYKYSENIAGKIIGKDMSNNNSKYVLQTKQGLYKFKSPYKYKKNDSGIFRFTVKGGPKYKKPVIVNDRYTIKKINVGNKSNNYNWNKILINKYKKYGKKYQPVPDEKDKDSGEYQRRKDREYNSSTTYIPPVVTHTPTTVR